MIRSVNSFLLFSILTMAFGMTALAQNNNAIIGVVNNTSNRPIYNVRVELLDEVEMTIKQAYTDAAGRYSFRSLSSGTFIVKVHSNGNYVGQKARINLYAARVGGGSHFEQLDFVLKDRSEAKGSTTPSNAGAAFAQDVPENARKAYERGVKQLDNNKQIDQGIASLQEAINFFPTYFVALERFGVEMVKRQQYEPAREALVKAVDVNPNGASCYYALGVAQFNLRRMPEAVESLRRSLLLAPVSPNAAFAHFYLGMASVKVGKPAEAETHLKKSYEVGGNSVPADGHMHLAQIYSNNKRYKEAADELELFLKHTPDARDSENIKNIIRQLRAKAKATAP